MVLFKKKEKEVFVSPMEGILVAIDQIPDPVFAQKCMGNGFGIDLTNGIVVAPMSGEIISTFPTGHAYGIRTKDGIEILIHIGMDTVELQGEGFQPKVRVGDMVSQGETLVEVDLDLIRSKGKSLVSPVIFTSGQKIELLKQNREVQLQEISICEII